MKDKPRQQRRGGPGSDGGSDRFHILRHQLQAAAATEFIDVEPIDHAHGPADFMPAVVHSIESNGFQPLAAVRSEEHTSELQSRENLVCRLLLEKKTKTRRHLRSTAITKSIPVT